MIGSLRGTVLDRTSMGELLVEVGGVGYRVAVPAICAASSELGGPIFLHVHTHVREDDIVLYGFPTRDERDCFEALLTAHGVGPALAMAIISFHAPAPLRRIVATDDLDSLMVVPGVGRKTAARLLIDLKAKLDGGDAAIDLAIVDRQGSAGARSEVRAALAGLGYSAEEVVGAVRALPEEGSVEELLRAALRELASSR